MNKMIRLLATSHSIRILASLAYGLPSAPAFAGNGSITITMSEQMLDNPRYDFAPDAGLAAFYPMLECSGGSTADRSGMGNTLAIAIAAPSSWSSNVTAPTWSADCGLRFTTGTSYLALPATVQGIQTIEVAFGSAVVAKNTVTASNTATGNSVLTGYHGATPAPAMWLASGYSGNDNAWMGYANTILSSYISNDPTAVGTTGSVDNGFHVAVMQIDPATGIRTLWLDGIQQTPFDQVGSSSAPATSGGYWELGGDMLGNHPDTYGTAGFQGTIYGASYSISTLTARQIAQDFDAWKRLAAYKGAHPSPAYGPTLDGPYLLSLGESNTWGHGLPDPGTMKFTAVAASTLTTATEQFWTGDTDAADSAGSFTITAGRSIGGCNLEAAVLGANVTGPKFVLFEDNGNAESGLNSWPDINLSTRAGIIAASFRTIGAEGACARAFHSHGWTTIMGMKFASGGRGVTYYDRSVKDVVNPLRRQYALKYFDAYFDGTSDPRMGADAAGAATTTNNCLLKGTAGPSYQGDTIHGTQCAQSYLGQDYAELIQYLTNSQDGVSPDGITATNSTQTLTDAGNRIILSGSAAQTLTLLPCGGQMQGEVLATVTNGGTAAATVLPGTEPNSGGAVPAITDPMNGRTAGFSLQTGRTASFVVTRGSDAAGTCGIVSSS